ncbi:MAG: hypothetical protein WCO07_03300 [bacterium]
MKKVIILNKKEGETPLEALKHFCNKNHEYVGVPMTYAGRLDPMASGLLLVLTGEETKNKEKYLNLEKEYEFEILFGFSTDTYDILGKLSKALPCSMVQAELEGKIKNEVKSFIGESIQKYPMYSSKTVKGKPLFMYARRGKEVEVPDRKIFIKKLKLRKIKKINSKKLLKDIEKRIKKVKGDFRQNEILKIWEKELSALNKKDGTFFIASFKIKCSTGTYIRGLANSLGKKMWIPALAYSIKRTKVGKYVL